MNQFGFSWPCIGTSTNSQTAAFLNKPATGTVHVPEQNLGQVFNLPSPDIPEVHKGCEFSFFYNLINITTSLLNLPFPAVLSQKNLNQQNHILAISSVSP